MPDETYTVEERNIVVAELIDNIDITRCEQFIERRTPCSAAYQAAQSW